MNNIQKHYHKTKNIINQKKKKMNHININQDQYMRGNGWEDFDMGMVL